MRKVWLVKILALAVVVLFVSVIYQPIIADNTISIEKESDYSNVDFEHAKDYFFQILVDISNNPDVKELLRQNNQKMFISDYDYKSAFSQILFKKPRLLKSILFTRPKMTFEYLETAFNKGLEIVDILGEEDSSKILEYISNINPDLFYGLKNIIADDEELSNRVSVLEEMNNNLNFNLDFFAHPIICAILISLRVYFSINILITYGLWNLFNKLGLDFPIINIILESIYYFYGGILNLIYVIGYMIFDCWGYTP